MADVRCGLAILPVEAGDSGRLIASLESAKNGGLGDFTDVVRLPAGGDGARGRLSQAAAAARDSGCDWLLAVTSAETLAPDIFAKAAPALRLHASVWGGAGLLGDTSVKPEPITRLAAQDLPNLFHAALAWWIGPAHFVKPEAALDAIAAVQDHSGWYADYLVHLWRNASAYKTAQRLTVFDGTIPPFPAADRARLVEILEREPVFMTVRHGPHMLRLPYTGVNPVIEREQMRGLFFEDEELSFLHARLPAGMRVVDAGANTGNHTLFFSAVMGAELVIPIEPHPRAVAAIRDVVAANELRNVETAQLGSALGAEAGRLRAVHSAGGGLGATRLVTDPLGETPVKTLDECAREIGRIDFIKIDVEGMEMDVLKGASSVLARDRPWLFIEVLDAKLREFMAWVDAHGYAIEKLFPDKTHCNYFLAPHEGREGRSA